MDPTTLYIVFGVSAVVLAIAGFFTGSAFRRKSAEKAIGSAEEEAMVLKSIEKTLTYKNDKISSVKIKIMGKDAESLGGHIDLSEQQ